MHTINTSTLAALEELLQNTSRPAPLDFLPIYFDGGAMTRQCIGRLNPELSIFLQQSLAKDAIPYLKMHHDYLQIASARPDLVSASLTKLAERLEQAGFIPGWRNEPFAWVDHDNHAYFQLERSAFRALGLRSTAIHVNGFTHSGYIWLSRRSENKFIDPGLLDNLAAGGIAADETPWVCAKRELWEEAGVPMAISEQINPVGRMHMCRPIAQLGFHDEQVYIYDLALPEQFVPTNHDGEVSGFIEISYSEAAARILADEFTVDAAFVTADFILRNYTA
jgi:8-oxo-dGTP pyrophosphatase MutT (NUDIX family)